MGNNNLKEEGSGFAVVFFGSNVQGRQSYFASGVVFQQDGHDLVVTLLQSHGQWGESILLKEKRVEIKDGALRKHLVNLQQTSVARL